MFEMVFVNGFVFRNVFDLLSVCHNQEDNTIALKVTKDGLKVETSTKRINDMKCFTSIMLHRENFKNFYLKDERAISIFVNPKYIYKHTKNMKRKDGLRVQYYKCKLVFTTMDSTTDFNSRERKEIGTVPYSLTSIEDNLDSPKGFVEHPYVLASQEFKKLKKETWTRKEPVKLEIFQDKYLKVHIASTGAVKYTLSSFNSNYTPNEQDIPQSISLSGEFISILVRLVNLTNLIKVYQMVKTDSDVEMLKITANIDVPKQLGSVDIFLLKTTEYYKC